MKWLKFVPAIGRAVAEGIRAIFGKNKVSNTIDDAADVLNQDRDGEVDFMEGK